MIKIILAILYLFTMSTPGFSDEKIKAPNVSGQFYPSEPRELSRQIEEFTQRAPISPVNKHVDILIAPHAGYIYSGPVAAYSFKAVSENKYSTIIILAPSHFYGFDGISIWSEGGFQTPLGVIEVDQELSRQLIAASPKASFEPAAFEREHSLEVELPFLQKTFKDFKIVPVLLGQTSFETLQGFASALDQIVGQRKDILILVSTDMSHYHEDSVARDMDLRAIKTIQSLDAERVFRDCQQRTIEMCGYVPVTAALLYAKKRQLNQVDVLRYATSADATGDKASVVGYTSAIIYANSSQEQTTTPSLTIKQKRRLIEIAKKTIEMYVKTGQMYEVNDNDSRLLQEEGTFVTIRKHGQLRGCIGNILGRGPLARLVRDMAISAASDDPRFQPVKADELDGIEIDISVLSKPWPIKNTDEIIMGVHGVIVSQGPFRQGIFLPEVATETGWSKDQFLSELCSQKAGLSPDCWKDPKTKIDIFTTESFSEKDLK